MGSLLKSVAKVAAPVIGNAIAPGVGGFIGAGLSGAIGGGGLKGALAGIAGQALGNLGGGVLGNIMKGGLNSNIFNGVSLLGNGGSMGALGKIFGGDTSGIPLGQGITWDAARAAVPDLGGLGSVMSKLPAGIDSIGSLGTQAASSGGGILDDILSGIGLKTATGGLDFGKLATILDVVNAAEPPEGLQTQADFAKARAEAEKKQAEQNAAFMQALNAPGLNRQQVAAPEGYDYTKYGQAPNTSRLFFDEVNPSLPQAFAEGGQVQYVPYHGAISDADAKLLFQQDETQGLPGQYEELLRQNGLGAVSDADAALMRQKGLVPDNGTGGQDDTVPALLSPLEYIMTAEEVAAAGDGNPHEGARKLKELGRELVNKKRAAKGRNPSKAPKKLQVK